MDDSLVLRARFAERVFFFERLIRDISPEEAGLRASADSIPLSQHLQILRSVFAQFLHSQGVLPIGIECSEPESVFTADLPQYCLEVLRLRAAVALQLGRRRQEPLSELEAMVILHDEFHSFQINVLRFGNSKAEPNGLNLFAEA